MERDLRIDSLRGVFLCTLTVTHLGLPISRHVNHLLGLFSFAEALVFLSGLVTGITCVKTYKKYGIGKVTRHALARSFEIYLGNIIPAIILLGLAAVSATALHYFQSRISLLALAGSGDMSLTEILLYIGALIYQPYYFDILPMFILFMLLTPLFIFFIGNNRAPVIFALSGTVWLAVQLGAGHHWFNDWTFNGIEIGGFFNLFAWQFLFLIACYIGFNLRQGLPPVTRHPAFLALCGIIAVAGFMMRYGILFEAPGREALFISKRNVGTIRLINFFAFACLVAEFGRRFPKALVQNWLALLGQHPLQVFSFQIILCYLSTPIIWRLAGISPLLANSYAILGLASLTLPVLAHIHYSNWRRGPKKALATETPK